MSALFVSVVILFAVVALALVFSFAVFALSFAVLVAVIVGAVGRSTTATAAPAFAIVTAVIAALLVSLVVLPLVLPSRSSVRETMIVVPISFVVVALVLLFFMAFALVILPFALLFLARRCRAAFATPMIILVVVLPLTTALVPGFRLTAAELCQEIAENIRRRLLTLRRFLRPAAAANEAVEDASGVEHWSSPRRLRRLPRCTVSPRLRRRNGMRWAQG